MKHIVHRDSDYLEHHGILGQKWGVRRYQNPDGTLTEEGKKRYLPNGKYDAVSITDDYLRYGRYNSKGKAAFGVVKNEVTKSDAYSKAKETLAKANVKPSDMYRVKPKNEIKTSIKEIDDFIRKTLNNIEYNYESPYNATTMMAYEFVNDILKDISKERKQQMRNDPSERLNKPKKEIKTSMKEIGDFIIETLNNTEHNHESPYYESPYNATTMTAYEFANDILKDISKERKQQK